MRSSKHMHHSNEVMTSHFQEKIAIFDHTMQSGMVSSNSSFKTMTKDHVIETNTHVPKLGVMLVGLGGNNGSTMVAGIMANKKRLSWETK